MTNAKIKVLLLIVVSVIALLCSCEWDNMVVGYELIGNPVKTGYIANIDTELDFSGIKTIIHYRGGYSLESSWGIVTESQLQKDDSANKWQIIHSIDFTKPDFYDVEIYYKWYSSSGFLKKGGYKDLSYKFVIHVTN